MVIMASTSLMRAASCSRLQSFLFKGFASRRSRLSSHAFSSTSDENTVMVTIDDARSTTTKALQMIGWDAQDASLQAEIMTAAEVCGNNQGLVKMYQPTQMQPAPNAGKPFVERSTSNSVVLNANQAPGMLAAVMGADKAIELCTEQHNTIAVVCTHNSSTSSGQLAFYVERIAKRGLIGVCLANSPEIVSPAQGAKAVFGTNPLAVGVPQANALHPFTFDMATSAIALFGVLSSKAKNEPLPPNVAYDKDGNWTTDANQVLNGGAIATFGGHKGAGLSLCVELLAGALSGSAVVGMVEKKTAKSWGHTIIAINPKDLVDDFEQKSAAVIQAVKDAGSHVRIPGERSMKMAEDRRKAGVMPIPRQIWESIMHTAEHGLAKTS
ncbi:hypothetical protein MPSEU_000174700 [Mayamaea pseudoterrestris]|nr:hypothetical protein MPSEU_000174700 [Mayamaea pseudoterrestris]